MACTFAPEPAEFTAVSENFSFGRSFTFDSVEIAVPTGWYVPPVEAVFKT
jgi:hypothetical protein